MKKSSQKLFVCLCGHRTRLGWRHHAHVASHLKTMRKQKNPFSLKGWKGITA